MAEVPLVTIQNSLLQQLPRDLIKYIPKKWEKIGDILVIKLDKRLNKYKETIGKHYAEALNCKTVLNDTTGISGVFREPNVEHIYGSKETETIHIENRIKYKLDPQRVMFSSGNMDERIRISKISNKKEIIVDLFAGIGYFTLPIAVFSKPKKIFSCEINPISYKFLCENVVLNNVTSIVEPLIGDNIETAPRNIADRVILGFINDTYRYLPFALECLKEKTGVIHYHDVFPEELIPNKPLKIINKIAENNNIEANVLKYRSIKSYAPGINHVVFDIKFGD